MDPEGHALIRRRQADRHGGPQYRGLGGGRVAATIEFTMAAGREAELRDWLARTGLDEVGQRQSLTGWHSLME